MLKMPVSIFKQVRFMKQSLFLKKCSKFCYVLFAVCGCLACTQNQKIEWPQVTNETKLGHDGGGKAMRSDLLIWIRLCVSIRRQI